MTYRDLTMRCSVFERELSHHVDWTRMLSFRPAVNLQIVNFYRAGRSTNWMKVKNPKSLALLRTKDGGW